MFGIKKSILEERYVNSRIILAIDLLVAFFGNLIACFCLNLAYRSDLFVFSRLSVLWVGLSFIFSYVFFRFFRSYRAAIHRGRDTEGGAAESERK